jgi:ribulose-bisphosphate carboxylase large chain
MIDDTTLQRAAESLAPAPDGLSATYALETVGDPIEIARELAGEASSGTFVKTPGQNQDLEAKHGARVIDVRIVGDVPQSGLPSRQLAPDSDVRHAVARIWWPPANTASLSACLTAAAGNITELASLTGIRLLDITLPRGLLDELPRPPLGISGTRRLVGATGRPLLGTIIKPSVGLDPETTAAMAATVAAAGLDFIKDDELLCNPPYNRIVDRVRAVEAALDRCEARTGHRPIFAYNVTADTATEMIGRADTVMRLGGRCVMVNLNIVGLSAVLDLRKNTDLPIHGHRAGWGLLGRSSLLGMAFEAYQTLWRAVGIDHLHVSGLRSKFWESDAVVLRSIAATLRPLRAGTDDRVLPVLSSGQTAQHIPHTAHALGHCDFLLLAGGAIWAHPGGPVSGVRSLAQAWEAYETGERLEDFAAHHPELAAALTAFPSRERSR